MKKHFRILSLFLLIGALAAGVIVVASQSGCKGKGTAASEYQWVTVDENYAPKNAVEEFIKNDAEIRNFFPIQIKNYGNDPKMLKRFKGTRFAQPTKNVLGMFFKGLEDWMLVDIKWKVREERKKEGEEPEKVELEAKRTMLYVYAGGKWTVADNGTLLE